MRRQPRLLPSDMQLMNTRTLHHKQGGVLHVVGVAHFSQASVQEVKSVIRGTRPEAVAIELCGERYGMLDRSHVPLYPVVGDMADQQLLTLIDPFFWLYHLPMYAVQALTGVRNGEEQMTAAAEAAELGAKCMLVDRRVSITVARCMDRVVDFIFSRQLFAMIWRLVCECLPFGSGHIQRSTKGADFYQQYCELQSAAAAHASV